MKKRHPESLQNCLNNFKSSWSEIDHLLDLTKNWEKIVGQELSNECKPLKIENGILTIVANHPQWRQALIYNKHKLKESICKFGIEIINIRITQNYTSLAFDKKVSNIIEDWNNHPSRIKNKKTAKCKFCERPTPLGEIERWGKCSFCWREKQLFT